jgi:glycosyltransferase involved in cell wall biosynthesis
MMDAMQKGTTSNAQQLRMREQSRPLISIIIPVFNEAPNVHVAYERIKKVIDNLQDKYTFEVLFCDNMSEDKTFELVTQLARIDPRVRGIRYAQNFGFNRSVLTGLCLARGQAAIQIDCDMQDPPEMFPQMLDAWSAGHDMVAGVRHSREDGHSYIWARSMYYRILRQISDDNVILDSGDFRLVDQSIVESLRMVNDVAPYVRGLTSIFARNPAYLPYDRSRRTAGKSKFPFRRLIGLAIEGMLAHSIAPLRLASYAGLLIATLMGLLGLGYIVTSILYGAKWPAGFTTITVLLLTAMSLNALFLGVIGEYVGRIYHQTRVRPITVIRDAVNMGGEGCAEDRHLPFQVLPERRLYTHGRPSTVNDV